MADLITRNDAHEYFVDGRGPYPSVTTVVDAAVGKGGLISWVRRHAIEYTYDRLTDNYGPDVEPPWNVDALEAGATKAALAEAELGDRVHGALEEAIKRWIEEGVTSYIGPVPGELEGHVDAFKGWHNAYRPRWVASERLIFHPEYEYGGTLDALSLMALEYENELVLLDFKSGKRAWKEHILQLAAYRAALIEEGVPVDRCAIVHVRPGLTPEQMWHPIEVNDSDFDAFLSCLDVFRWLNSRSEP